MTSHYVLALTGSPVRLSSVLAGAEDASLSALWMQPRATNANPVYLGTDDGITSTDYGVRFDAPVGGVPPPPFNVGEFSGTPRPSPRSPLKLADFYVLGTSGEFLHLLAVGY